MEEIRLKVHTYASLLHVKTRIWRYGKGFNHFVDCDMIFDTGASMTTISKFTALRAGYNLETAKTVAIDTVGQTGIPALRTMIPHLELGGYDLGPVARQTHECTNSVHFVGNGLDRSF